MTTMPTVPTTSEINPTFQMTFHSSPYDNLPPYENVLPVTTTNLPYLNVPPVIISSSCCTNSNSDTLIPTPSDQIVSDIISFLIQASPHSLSNSLQLIVFENMLKKHYKPSLVSHIDLMLSVNPNRYYITFESIVRSCISFL